MDEKVLRHKASISKRAWNESITKLHILEKELEKRKKKYHEAWLHLSESGSSFESIHSLLEDIHMHKRAISGISRNCKTWKSLTKLNNKIYSDYKNGKDKEH